MSYPGNPSLPQETQQRNQSTFEQSLDLVAAGKEQEALAGCEFILQLDPLFAPAQRLQQRLQSAERPVQIDDLRPVEAAAATIAIDPSSLADLGTLEAAPVTMQIPTTPSPAAAAAPASGLAAVLHDLLTKRNFQQVLQIAETQREAIAKDPQLLEMVETAQERLESEGFVTQFLNAAKAGFASGNLEKAKVQLAKARELDPDHPDVLALAAQLAAAPPAQAPPPQAAPTPPPQPTAGGTDDLLSLQQQSLGLDDGIDDPFAEDLPSLGIDDLDDDDLGIEESEPEVVSPLDLDNLSLDDAPPVAAEPIELGADSLDADSLDVDLLDADALDADSLDAGLLDADALPSLDADALPSLEDTQPATPPAPDVDLAPTPAAPAGGENSQRIQQLLAEGQEIFDRGELQEAIDVWSRIFLIDIDNKEASDRIEEARQKKAEIERQAEELFHQSVDYIEVEELEQAQDSLRQVLALVPSHPTASDYLQQLEAGQIPKIAKRAAEAVDIDTDLDATAFVDPDMEDDDAGPSMEAAVQRDRVVVVKKTDRKLVIAGVGVALLVAGLAGFLILKWDELFPNAETAMPTRPQIDDIARATKMHEGGNTENAILLLQKIEPEHPSFEDAQALIAQWQALVQAPEEVDTGPSPEQIQRRDTLLDAARAAYTDGRNIRAGRYFDLAEKIAPLETDDLSIKRDAVSRLDHLSDEIEEYDLGEYESVLPKLWRKLDERPGDKDIELLIVSSYYNLALGDLQRGNARGAYDKIGEALGLAPEERDLQRLQLFAQTYMGQEQDLLYRIYVKYLPSR